MHGDVIAVVGRWVHVHRLRWYRHHGWVWREMRIGHGWRCGEGMRMMERCSHADLWRRHTVPSVALLGGRRDCPMRGCILNLFRSDLLRGLEGRRIRHKILDRTSFECRVLRVLRTLLLVRRASRHLLVAFVYINVVVYDVFEVDGMACPLPLLSTAAIQNFF